MRLIQAAHKLIRAYSLRPAAEMIGIHWQSLQAVANGKEPSQRVYSLIEKAYKDLPEKCQTLSYLLDELSLQDWSELDDMRKRLIYDIIEANQKQRSYLR